jgi:hypothetical protein
MPVLSTISLFAKIVSLLHSICDGSFEKYDFPFTIGGEQFEQLWMLVDGIYPQLSRFVKTISVPLGVVEALYSLWQEAKHKGIELFFGVFKKKFNVSSMQFLSLSWRM